MTGPTFDWDAKKAAGNWRKHRVPFEEALTAFRDPLAKIHADPEHSELEERDILIGHSTSGHLVLVAFTERRGTIRLISARETTRRERQAYEQKS